MVIVTSPSRGLSLFSHFFVTLSGYRYHLFLDSSLTFLTFRGRAIFLFISPGSFLRRDALSYPSFGPAPSKGDVSLGTPSVCIFGSF